MKPKRGVIVVGRDAGDGAFIKVKDAKRRRATAIVKRMRVWRDASGRFAKAPA